MALEGTLDTVALSDVLRLLASTEKTGDLALAGERASGRLAFAHGALVGGEGGGATGATDTLFALLRNRTGDFAFTAGEARDDAHDPVAVDDALGTAEVRLAEWEAIEAVVPGLDARVALAEDLPDAEVVIDRTVWRLLRAVGTGTTVAAIGTALDLDEWHVSASVRDLVATDLAVVSPAPDSEPVDAGDGSDQEDAVRAELAGSSASADGAGSLLVDLDSALDAPATNHAYLSADPADDADLPEPLLATTDAGTTPHATNSTDADAREVSPAPAPGTTDGLDDEEGAESPEQIIEAPEQITEAPAEVADEDDTAATGTAATDAAPTQPTDEDDEVEVERQLAALSPAAARAVASAARGKDAPGAGRSALRRIISSGR